MAACSVSPTRQTTAAPRAASCAVAFGLAIVTATVAAAAGLDEPLRASWKSLPLRDWAARVTPLAARPVIVDRRLDSDTAITLECRGEPLREALELAARQAGAEVAVLRGTIRIVPHSQRGICERAEDARDRDLGRLPVPLRTGLAQRSAWSWPEAARPRDLVNEVAAEAGIELEGLDTLPHDHFPAASLPPLSRAERIDLVLAHFDRRVAWRSRGGRLAAAIVRLDADLPPPRRDTGRRPKPEPRPPQAGGQELFSLKAEAPLDELLAAVARQQGLDLELDPAALEARGIASRAIVRIDVQDVSRAALLDRIVGPLGLAWRIEARRLRVFATAAEAVTE